MTLAATGRGGPTSTWREKQALSFSRGDGRRLFLTLLTVWEWVPWKRSESFWSTSIIMMVPYQMRTFPCTTKSSWAFCCSKVNVRCSIEPICDPRIAKFSRATQILHKKNVSSSFLPEGNFKSKTRTQSPLIYCRKIRKGILIGKLTRPKRRLGRREKNCFAYFFLPFLMNREFAKFTARIQGSN